METGLLFPNARRALRSPPGRAQVSPAL